MITLFVGDNQKYLSKVARQHSSDAFLLDKSNYKEFLRSDGELTVYTSHCDLPKITDNKVVIYEVMLKADIIYYEPPQKWSDSSDEFSLTNTKYLTEYFLHLVEQKKHNVKNLNIDTNKDLYLKLLDKRKTDKSVIFCAGCSITYGTAIDKDQSFPHLVSDILKRDLVDLSFPGSSIEFASDQLLRSDIKKDDIVIWGLTQELRFTIWDSKQRKVNFGDWTKEITNESNMYRSTVSVYKVINFCKKIGAKLILLPLICSENLRLILRNEKEYCQLPYKTQFIDYGNDNIHPGKKQHKEWSEICLSIIKEK